MVKRPGRDQRDDDTSEGNADRFRVDRVYVPSRQSSPALPRASSSTSAPPASEDRELNLRHQVSKLQRQLADAQRELANKDDELAAEVEHRLLITAARDKAVDDLQGVEARIEELAADAARAAVLQEQLAEAVTRYDEVAEVVERERGGRGEAEVKVVELTAALEDARLRRIDERAQRDELHANELEMIEGQKREALLAAEAAYEAAVTRMREAQEAELAELQGAHERSMAALRGELEPAVVEARSLAAERERLASEVAALRAEAERVAVERADAQRRELAQQADQHASELAAQARTAAAEVSKALGERDLEILEHQQTVRRAELRELQWEQTALSLRDAQKQLQTELAAANERNAVLAAQRALVDDRLANATATAERLTGETRTLRDQLEALEAEVRRLARERQRLVAWLREGMGVLGELPPPALGDALPELDPEDLTAEAAEEPEPAPPAS